METRDIAIAESLNKQDQEKEIEEIFSPIELVEEPAYILEAIGHPAMLELLAEECSELAHAALKFARILRGENPTPVTIEEAERNFIEEFVDVDICMDEVQSVSLTMSMEEAKKLSNKFYSDKISRWKERLQSKKD